MALLRSLSEADPPPNVPCKAPKGPAAGAALARPGASRASSRPSTRHMARSRCIGVTAASLRDGRPAASRGLSAGDIGSEFGPVPLCECGLSFVKSGSVRRCIHGPCCRPGWLKPRSEEHTSELQSRQYLVCRLLLEKKKRELTERKAEAALEDFTDPERVFGGKHPRDTLFGTTVEDFLDDAWGLTGHCAE